MNYLYAQQENHEDLAAGRVLFHRPGSPNFPVRLAEEIFLRGVSHLPRAENLTLYDPCCGSGYLLTVLGLLHPEKIRAIIASDISEDALATAERNLKLLTPEGLCARINELKTLYAAHGKDSHREAIASAERLLGRLTAQKPPAIRAFHADALEESQIAANHVAADLIIADVPYGALTEWKNEKENPLAALLQSLRQAAASPGIIALCSDKSQKIADSPLRRLERHQVGKRRFELYRVE